MPIFVHTGTGREFDVAETAAAGFRSNPDFTEAGGRPSPSDLKDVWVAWAESHGHDTDGLTKAQLQELE